MQTQIEALQRLAEQFARLPGIGKKSAVRLAYSILELSDEEAQGFAKTIIEAKEKIHLCPICQNITDRDVCSICSDPARNKKTVCIVADPRVIPSMEKVREYKGVYHVLHGIISPMNGITPDKLKIRELLARLETDSIEEVIVAINPTVEGDATAMYLSRILKPLGVKVTRLAYGLSVGSDLEYADEVTLFRAFTGRQEV
jgi:recombination protein RecR